MKSSKTIQRKELLSIVNSLAASVNTALGNKLRHSQTLENYLNIDLDPASYADPDVFRHDYLLANIARKFSGFETQTDLEKVALDSFFESEVKCKKINDMISGQNNNPELNEILHYVKRKIASIIGESPLVKEVEPFFDFSGGATYCYSRENSHPFLKFNHELLEVTPTCYKYAKAFLLDSHLMEGKKLKLVPGSRLVTVPKSYKTNRVIAIEPLCNMYIQKGIGGFFRKALRRCGINLNDQEINQKLAKQGSIDGSLATIDLSSASDSISFNLVQEVFPKEWFDLMCDTRSNRTELHVKGKEPQTIDLEKFSSMGNGFTFEMESLIFYAIACYSKDRTSSNSTISVYGDDIIVGTEVAESLIRALSLVGFSTNKDKTFIEGPFRESCGKHYFQGIDVTPVYLRSFMTEKTGVSFYNQIYVWTFGDPRYSHVILRLRKHLRLDVKFGPDHIDQAKPSNEVDSGSWYFASHDEIVLTRSCNYLFKRRCIVTMFREKRRTLSLDDGYIYNLHRVRHGRKQDYTMLMTQSERSVGTIIKRNRKLALTQ